MKKGTQFKEVYFHDFCLKISTGDNCFQLEKKICVAQNIIKSNKSGRIYIVYRKFVNVDKFFDYPIRSDTLDIFKVSSLNSKLEVCDSSNLFKCCLLPISGNHYICIPLIHTISKE